jgi:hypothetical protein
MVSGFPLLALADLDDQPRMIQFSPVTFQCHVAASCAMVSIVKVMLLVFWCFFCEKQGFTRRSLFVAASCKVMN